jgi:hypothetical protein
MVAVPELLNPEARASNYNLRLWQVRFPHFGKVFQRRFAATSASQAAKLFEELCVEQEGFQRSNDLVGHPVTIEELALPSTPSMVDWQPVGTEYVRLEPVLTGHRKSTARGT